MADLDAILSGQTEPVAEQPRGEDGRGLPAAEAATAPPAETPPETTPEPARAEAPAPALVAEPPDDRVPQAALLDERRKRQAYEREVESLREQLARNKEPAKPAADVWTDPEAYVSAAEQRAIAAAEARMSDMVGHITANVSEQFARRQYPDYDQKRAEFSKRLEADPVIKAEFNRHIAQGGDLGEFVYSTATKLQQMAELTNIDAYRAKVEAEVRARLEAEYAKRTPVPQSLNAIPSPATSTEIWSGPPPLEAILKRN